jgi:N-carbamoyl-L-amino-acid hydrolase
MPGLALIKLLNAIDKRFPEICGPRTVWTTGRITLEPREPQHHPGPRRGAVPAARRRSGRARQTARRAERTDRRGQSRERCQFELSVISHRRPP